MARGVVLSGGSARRHLARLRRHVTQMGALYCPYRAGALVRDRDPEALDFEVTQPLPVVGEE